MGASVTSVVVCNSPPRLLLPLLLSLLAVSAAAAAAAAAAASAAAPHAFHDAPPRISAVFLPYFPCAALSREVEFARAVTAARRADPRNFSRDASPYWVRYAVYNFAPEPMWAALVDAVLEARAARVEVQVLVDFRQLWANYSWNAGLHALRAAGLRFAPSQIGLSDAQRRSVELCGIVNAPENPGLMHLKTRLFTWPAAPPVTSARAAREDTVSVVLTGSFNPEADGRTFPNNDTLFEIRIPRIVERYRAKYDAVLFGHPLVNSWNASSPVNVLFAPDTSGPRLVDKLVEWISEERELVLIWVFALRNVVDRKNVSLFDALMRAKSAGAVIIVVTDVHMIERGKHRFTEELMRNGIPVAICNNTAGDFVAMHAKNALLGVRRARIITDTSNWSGAAMGTSWEPPRNDESSLWLNATGEFAPLALNFTSNFLAILRSYESQQPPSFPRMQKIVDVLAALPGWREIRVAFAVSVNVSAPQHWSGSVLVAGSVPELGDWNLAKAPRLVPCPAAAAQGADDRWCTTAPVRLPHGRVFEFSFVLIAPDGHVRWERCPGGHRRLVADPAFPGQPYTRADPGALRMDVGAVFCAGAG